MFAKWNDTDGRFSFALDDNGGLEISADAHSALFAAQAAGQQITRGADGLPVATDPTPPTTVQLAATARIRRAALLAASDWTQVRDMPDATAAKWSPYRQALRDVTKQSGFPAVITWPVSP